jgi:hypothetical protein
VDKRIGDRIEPMAQLTVQTIEIAEDAAEEEVLPDISEWALEFTLRLGAIGAARARVKAVKARQVDKGPVVDNEPIRILADDGGPHAIIEDPRGAPPIVILGISAA